MNKNNWYYENTRTHEITDIKDAAEWWASCGDSVDFWHWSDCCQEWLVFATREA